MLPSKEKVEKAPAKIVTTKIIGIGEVPYLVDDPWNKADRLYPCRSIHGDTTSLLLLWKQAGQKG